MLSRKHRPYSVSEIMYGFEISPMTTTAKEETGVTGSPVLVYDDTCGFCKRSVQFMLRQERRHDLLFVARDSELGKRLRCTYRLESIKSMVWIENGRPFTESDAVMKAADYLGGRWAHLATLGWFCPSFIRNRIYRFIARNRRRLSTACPLPTSEQRARFCLDEVRTSNRNF